MSLRAALVDLVAVVRRADGHHIDQGPNTAAVRVASRRVAESAERAAVVLVELEGALSDLGAAAAGGGALR